MRPKYIVILIMSVSFLISWVVPGNRWIIEKHMGYDLLYTKSDKENKQEYVMMVENGIKDVITFFSGPYNKTFEIFVHPDRHTLDSTWQKDWGMPDFRSECWMVASGVASRLDILSPVKWGSEACEHSFSDKIKTQKLITHELVHIYHGQLNASHDFSNTDGIDWFVEGLAVYASGQCDSLRISDVRKAISDNKAPSELDKFWTGKLKYGLSGSLVMFIDKKYGREILIHLLPMNKKADLLSALKISEPELIEEWKKYYN